MAHVTSRTLRQETRSVLERAAAGEDVTITVGGRPVARIVALDERPRWLRREAFLERLARRIADSELTDELAALQEHHT